MAESEELKSLLIKVEKESEKVGLKLNIQKTKIMASGCITSWQIDRETMETVTDFIFLGSKITADGDCSHEIKRCLLLGRKAMINLNSIYWTIYCHSVAFVFFDPYSWIFFHSVQFSHSVMSDSLWPHGLQHARLPSKQGDNIQPWRTPFLIWNQSVVPCPVLTVASWPAYRLLKRQVRWSGIPISFGIFHSLLWSTLTQF